MTQFSCEGKIEKPFGKKLSGQGNLFEIRVKHKGQWRAIYAYYLKDSIIILSAFIKKTQKTPLNESTTTTRGGGLDILAPWKGVFTANYYLVILLVLPFYIFPDLAFI